MAYREAFEQKGTLSDKRQKDIVRQRVQHHLFPSIFEQIRESGNALIKDTIQTIKMKTTEILALVRASFGLVCSDSTTGQMDLEGDSDTLPEGKLESWQQEVEYLCRALLDVIEHQQTIAMQSSGKQCFLASTDSIP